VTTASPGPLPARLADAGVTVDDVFKPGDLGELIHIHGVGNARDYGYTVWHEAYCARIAADFLIDGGGKRGRAWLAKKHGAVVGSVFVVETPNNAAQLRLLYASDAARGLGLGRWLVEAAIAHCRAEGFTSVFLWTAEGLHGARHIYESLGFGLTETKVAQGWGVDTHELRFDLVLA
jgi:GNAT superfamily N-acetyltransferase